MAFPRDVEDEIDLKRVLIEIAHGQGLASETGRLARLNFGEDLSVPNNLRFNDVPHERWVRSHMYSAVSAAVSKVRYWFPCLS